MKPERKKLPREVVIGLVLALVTVAIYSPVRHFEFLNFDDSAYVTANPNVFRGFSLERFLWAFSNVQAANWHPVTWLSHMLDCQLFGYQAGWHHLTSLFFHTANTLLVFCFLRLLTGAVFRSAMVAALFAWHPLHVESVAWVAERKDVLSTFFGLLTLIAYVEYARQAERRRQSGGGEQAPAAAPAPLLLFPSAPYLSFYFLSLLCFALGLMSKPMLVTLPCVMLLLDAWPLQRLNRANLRRVAVEKLPFFLLTVAVSMITVFAQKSGEAVVAIEKLPMAARLVNAVMAYAGYLRKMVWPSDLAPFYPYQHHVSAGAIIGALLVLAVISLVALRLARRAPYLLFGWLWYLGMLVPVIGLVQVGAQSMADRYTYLPLVGVFVMLVWGAAELLSPLRQRVRIAGMTSGLVLTGCIVVTCFQLQYWRNSEILFSRDLQLFPQGNAMAHHCVGRALYDRGADTEALPHFQETVRLLPDFVPGHLNLANCLSRQERYAEARFHYDEAIRLKPENAEAYKSLGASLAAQMKLDEARTNYFLAIKYKPDYVEAYMKLGTAEMAQGKPDEALEHLATAVRIHPDYAEAQYYLAHALQDHKRYAEAAQHYRAAIRANPNYADALNDLAWLLATERDAGQINPTEAINCAQRAGALTQHQNAAYLETLGIAFAAAGRFAEAMATMEKAIALANAGGNKALAAELQSQLNRLRAGRDAASPAAGNWPSPP